MATESRRDRRRIDAWSGITGTDVIPDGQFRWYDGVTGYNASEVLEVVGDGSTQLQNLALRQVLEDGAQDIYGVKTFDDIPVIPATTPTSDIQVVNRGFVLDQISVPPGFIYGLETESATDTDHDITINTGKCRDYADSALLELSSAITKQIDASWVVGNNNGGLFTGTVAVDTTYHLFVISNGTTVDAGFDTDIDASNAPSGYTSYRRVASFLTDSSANIIRTIQSGDRFTYYTSQTPYSTTTVAITRDDIGITIPTGIELIARLHAQMGSAVTTNVLLFESDMDDVTAAESNCTVRTTSGANQAQATIDLSTNSSGEISIKRAGTDVSGTLYINTLGWTDDRGRFGGK